MSKSKLKFVILIVSLFAFFIIGENVVKASDYNINVTSIEGLEYGDKLNDARIIATSDIDGTFSFYEGDLVVDSIGEQTFEVIFTPRDLDNYSSKRVSVNTNVGKRRISIVFVSPLYKQYDGNVDISLPEYSLIGIIDNEVGVNGNLIATLEGSYVGEGIGVTLSGLSLEGEKSEYYYIDFLDHSARVYPSTLEKSGHNATSITLEKDVYVDVRYSLKVVEETVNDLVEGKYTSFLKYTYEVYNHNNQFLEVEGKFKVAMELNRDIIEKERLQVYELTSKGEYKKLEYVYKHDKIIFEIENDSSLVFTTRNIEYKLIALFSGILIFSGFFLIFYRYRNSKIKGYKKY